MDRIFAKWEKSEDIWAYSRKIHSGLDRLDIGYAASALDRLEILAYEYKRLKEEESERKRKEEMVNNLKVGDIVELEGTGSCKGGPSFFSLPNRSGLEFIVSGIFPGGFSVSPSPNEFGLKYLCHNGMLVSVSSCRKHITRGQERRKSQSIFKSGSDIALSRTLEFAARERQLSEDEIEVLKSAISRLRKDGSANGYRKAERRKF